MAKRNVGRKQGLPWDVILAGIVALALILLRVGMGSSTDMRSRAATEVPVPTGFSMNRVRPARGVLLPPSVRTATVESAYPAAGQIPVELLLETGDAGITEASVLVSFDPNFLSITDPDVTLPDDLSASLQVEQPAPGRILVTVFITEEAGQAPLQFRTERAIAKLVFNGKGVPVSDIVIEPVPADSRLSGVRTGENPPEVRFRGAEGVQLDLAE